jgi:plastocyanin
VRVKRWTSLLVAGATVAAVVGVASTAGAANSQTLTIGVGGDRGIHGVTLEGMRFDAPTLNVHKGDTLTFQFRGVHTVTAIPAGINADDWRMQHMGRGGDYALIEPDVDDSPPAFEFNPMAIFPSSPTCGPTSNPCGYDGNSVVNSGLPITIKTFSITVNAKPNSSFWVLCLLHGMMQMQINVVPNGAATTTQAAINGYAKSTTASDNEQASALLPKLQKQSSHKVNGHKVWDAFAGFDGDGWGLDGMFPSTLHIKKGQFVRWHFAQLTGNIHTVTFPRKAAIDFANKDFSGSNMKCEGDPKDTPAGAPPTFCPGGIADLEVELRAGAVAPVGNHRYSGTGMRSSGVRGADTGNVAPYTLRFTRKSGKHGFSYACNVHGAMMTGHVIVKK